MTELDAEDNKLVVLARGAMGRAEARSGAAVRDTDGRTYAGCARRADCAALTALQAAVAAAVSSGARVWRLRCWWADRPTTPASPRCSSFQVRHDHLHRPLGQGARMITEPAHRSRIRRKSRSGRSLGGTMMAEFRSGFVCFVGRPNTGKSTLTNALVGTKVAITSYRPQTTRHTIRGIVHREDFQLILVDTPGLHRPRTLLGQRLNDLVQDTYSEVDVIGLCIPADEKIGPGDRWIDEQIRAVAPKTTLVGVVTKIDKVSKERVAAQLMAVSELVGPDTEIVPVSATTGEQVEVLIDVLAVQLPPGPAFYPDGELTDEPEEVLMAELIREAALEGVRDELPHSLAVVIEEIEPAGRARRPDRRTRHALRRARQPEGHRDRQGRRPPARGRHRRAHSDREAAGHQDLPGPARQGRQELAARPQTAWALRVLSAWRHVGWP